MAFYNDDDYDDDDYDEEDDDDSPNRLRGSINPFSSGGSGLPGSSGGSRFGSGSGGSSGDSGSRFGSGSGSSGSSPFTGSSDRFGSGSGSGSGSGGSSGGQRFGSGSGGSSGDSGSRFGSGSGGSSGDSGSRFGSGSGGSGSGGSSGGQRFGSGGSGSGGSSGDSGSRYGSGSGGSGSGGSSGGQRFGSGGSGSGSSSGDSGSRFGSGGSGSSSSSGGQRFGSGGSGSGSTSGSGGFGSQSTGGGTSGSRFGSGTSTSTGTHPTVKPDDKGGGRNIFGRNAGDDKKDTRPPDKKGDKPKGDQKGGGVGGFLGRGKKEDDGKKPDSRSQSAKGTSGDSKGGLSAITSRLPFGKGKADDKKPDARGKPDDKKGSQSPFGASKAGGVTSATKSDTRAPSKAKSTSAESGGLMGRIRGVFGGASTDKKSATSKTRASKVPQPVSEGLSLDQKLDILGVALMVMAVVVFFSSLSGQQGTITGTINNFFSQLVGQGAVAVPLVFGGIGFWLIIRHFGEEAPRIDPVRIGGLILFYVGALMLLMFIETFNYTTATTDTFPLYIEQSIAQGQGGGQVGAYLYNLLVTSLGELPAVVFVFGWLVVSIMFITRTSAAELTVYILSIWRSFRVAGQRRAQKRTAMRTALLEARAKEATEREKAKPVITKPQPAELTPQPVAGALPETTGESHRAIPIRMGNQTVTAELDAEGGIVPPPPKPTAMPDATNTVSQSATDTEKAEAGGKPRFLPFGGRGKGDEKSGNGKPTNQPEKKADTPTATEKAGGGFNPFRRNQPTSTVAPEDALTEQTTSQPVKPPAPKPTSTQTSGLTKPTFTPVSKQTTTSEVKPVSPFPDDDIDDDIDDEVEEAPRKIPLGTSTSETPVSRFGAQSTTTKDETTSKPTSPFGGSGTSPFSKPSSTGTSPAPSPFGSSFKPSPQSPIRDDEDDEMDDEDEAVSTGATFASSDDIFSRLGASASDDTASEEAPKPTPSPFGSTSRFGGSSSPFGASSAPKSSVFDEDEDDEDIDDEDEEPTADRSQRLDQIRSGTKPNPFSRPTTPTFSTADDEDDEDDYDDDEDDVPIAPRKPVSSPFADVKPSPFSATTTPTEETPAPKPTGFSPFRKPEDTASGTGDGDVTRSPGFVPPAFGASTPPKQTDTPQPTQLTPAPKPSPTPFSSSGASTEKPTSTLTSNIPKKMWRLPDARTLLASGSEGDIDREQLVRRAKVIEETLTSFGAPGRVVEINTGPVITQFGVEPDYLTVRGGKKVRVKVGQIAQLDKDIQLALGAKSIRIEAPVPGKGYVGIEVPNEEASLVSLRDVMESKQFNKIAEKSPLTIALGQSVDGAPISADLASMPHLLIAGTTGSGKSVCVNAIIASLLVRNTPDKVKFIMVDPKRVELTGYNGIPHLIAPVVVELERIVGVLKWVTREMDDRYKKFSNAGARNIEDYNQHITADVEPLPYIVVIVDELADLMMLAPDETERVITRIAALARATGIHLVIATQRPSVDVVTGLIKANFPARIAFAVAGGVDSRVILDQPGAERLLGRGDMLYMSGDSPAPLRLQGVYVSDMEINNICRFWRTQQPDSVQQKSINALVGEEPLVGANKPSIPINKMPDTPPPRQHTSVPTFWDDEDALSDREATSSGSNGSRDENGHEDELYEEAVEMVRRLNKASVSLLQRRLRIGYTRAARLIDIMEAQGVVGPATEGSKPREVLPPKK